MTLGVDEEPRQLLRRIVESLAWRQILSIDLLGHSLKFVTDFDSKLRVAAELDLSLQLFREVVSLYAELGWQDLESAVRERLHEVPYPSSRLEFGVAHYLTITAQEVAMRAYVDCRSEPFAAIARSYVEAAPMRPQPKRFLEFCEDPSNRPRAQELFERWLRVALLSFGRPGTPGDARAVELGLKGKRSAEMIQEFLNELGPFLARSGLSVPPGERLGLDLGSARAAGP